MGSIIYLIFYKERLIYTFSRIDNRNDFDEEYIDGLGDTLKHYDYSTEIDNDFRYIQ